MNLPDGRELLVQPANIAQHGTRHSVERSDPAWNATGLYPERWQSWGSISAAIVNRPGNEAIARSDYHRVAVSLTTIQGIVHINGGPAKTVRFLPGEISFTPGGVVTRTILPPARLMQALQSSATYDRIISETVRGGTVDFETRYPINDPLVSQIVTTLVYETGSDFLDHILVDALNTALAARMVQHFVDPSKIAPVAASGLPRERLQRVYDYIEAHLDDRLTLADLAAVACLSPYHFSRSFKQAVGVGPHQYVTQRRIDRAKTLMRRTRQPLASIAQEVGFTDQSHLTAIFRRETGMTPGRFRAALA
jgi:AraC family transcriptional regulator